MEAMVNKKLKVFYNKKIFLTGHTGFKGMWMSFLLNSLNAKICGYSLKKNNNNLIFKKSKLRKSIKNYFNDIRDKKNLFKALKKEKPDMLIHMAAQSLVLDSYQNPLDTFETNFNGTLNIMEAIKKFNIKAAIIVTTDKVYKNNNKKNKHFIENDILGGDDPYSLSKVTSEYVFDCYMKNFLDKKKNFATVRAGNVIGGGDRAKYRLLADYFRCKNKKKFIIRNPNSTRPWQHVLDTLYGYLLVLSDAYYGKLKFNNWNFSPMYQKSISTKEIIRKINYKNKKIVFSKLKNKNLEKVYLGLNSNRSRKYLKWKNIFSINETIKKIIEWENYNSKNSYIDDIMELQIKEYFQKLN